MLQGGEQNQHRPKNGPAAYITTAAGGVPNASEHQAKSKWAHKWAKWLHNPCNLGGPQVFRGWDKIRTGPQMGRLPA